MGLDIFGIVVWTIAGVITLCNREVTKLEYALCWIMLMVNLIAHAVEG